MERQMRYFELINPKKRKVYHSPFLLIWNHMRFLSHLQSFFSAELFRLSVLRETQEKAPLTMVDSEGKLIRHSASEIRGGQRIWSHRDIKFLIYSDSRRVKKLSTE